MAITRFQKHLMGNWIFQFWRFIVLNLKILKGVDHAKRS